MEASRKITRMIEREGEIARGKRNAEREGEDDDDEKGVFANFISPTN